MRATNCPAGDERSRQAARRRTRRVGPGNVLRAVLLAVSLGLLGGCPIGPDRDAGDTRGGSSAEVPTQPVPVEFETPAGFDRTDDYRIAVPLHDLRESRWVVPAGSHGYDVVAVTSYVLDADVSDDSDDQLVARIAGYAGKVAATSVTAPVKTTVAGFPAWQQSIVQPGDPVPLTYDATFVFAGHYLIQVICQYDRRRDQIDTGCRTVRDTLRPVFV